ncbi:prohead protease/major capsid protein fusion protein [Xanthobacter sp. KR7-225]|uniref:prohead protease/major capsid protein fusion protein n=1 Tax=Xanthobacter sp. KR7-225 TaxID=3156613 RepID=UPI0032B4B8D2
MNAPADIVTRRAPLAATSWNAEERTLEVTFSTGAEVERFDARGAYAERLNLAQDWTAFIGAPVLNSHRRGDLTDVLGSVQKAWTVGGNREARAVIKLSRRGDVEPIIQDILDGHLRGVSVGYVVNAWSESTEGGRRVKTATRWTPVELSIVPIPADRQATIRGETMTAPTPATADPAAATPPAAAAPTPTASAERAAVNAEIRSIAAVAGLDQAWIDGQIDAAATTDAARAAAFEALRSRSAPAGQLRTTTISIGVDHTDPALRAAAIGEALYTRATPGHTPSEAARAYVGLSIPEIARDCLRARGVSVTGLGAAEVVTRALHSTSDFVLALADTQGRVLATAYRAAASGLKPVARQVTLPDFRKRTFLRTSGISDLEKVNEAGEFKRGTFGEAGESVSLETFGKVFGITRQALVNDDTGALSDVPRKFGDAAARFEAAQLAKLLVKAAGAGPTMADGKTLFHADHHNLAGAGAAIDVTSLGTARFTMRGQTDDAGQLISVVPKALVVGPAKETEAQLITAATTPIEPSEVNPFVGALAVHVEPRLAGNAWYVVDPLVDGLIYAHLASEPGPQLESRAGFDVDGIETRIRLDFGCAFIDWRGWYRNPGN